MKISVIQSNNYSLSFGMQNNKPVSPDNKKKVSAAALTIGLSAVAAIGLATYGIIKNKKTSVKQAAETLSDISKSKKIPESVIEKPVVSTVKESESFVEGNLPMPKVEQQLSKISGETAENKVITEPLKDKINAPEPKKEIVKTEDAKVQIEPFSYKGIGKTEPFEGIQKMFYIDKKDGTGLTSQRFYHKDKLYESNIWEEVLGDKPEIVKHTRYNFAYENGRIVGVAKQDLYRDGQQYGIYKEDGTLEYFPILVKMKGEKDFHDAKVYTADALFEKDARFNPYNI